MSLEDHLKKQIKTTGPITVLDFMTRALYDPQEGYYATKVPMGRTGDYITAPEMTQVFGEVIAGWLIDIWQQAGSPNPFHLIELGPGRGTLMADILRAFKSLMIPLPKVHLVEVSSLLKEQQRATLGPSSTQIFWHTDLSMLPNDQGFCLMIANEFWDALPIQQFVKINQDWIERRIELQDNEFIFMPKESTTIHETCPAISAFVIQIANHLKKHRGTALFLDYGYDQPEAVGDTLQALYHHQKLSPLDKVGQADLTHHVDFHQLKSLFEENTLKVHRPVPQGDFLKAIGFEERTSQLCEHATPEQQSALRTAAVRLTHPTHMGTLFKAMCVSDHALQPMGFGGEGYN